MFHLEHHAFVGLVSSSDVLSDDTVKTCAFKAAEPIRGNAAVARGWRNVNRRRCGCKQSFQLPPPLLKWLAPEIPVSHAKQVEKHERGWGLTRQQPRSCFSTCFAW